MNKKGKNMETRWTTKIVEIGGYQTVEVRRSEILLNLDTVVCFEPYIIRAKEQQYLDRNGVSIEEDNKLLDIEGNPVVKLDCTKLTLINGSTMIIEEEFDELVEDIH